MVLDYTIWGHTWRPWGYEVRVDVWDENGQHYPICMTFKSELDRIETELVADYRVAQLGAELMQPIGEPERAYGEGEIIELLIKKGYLIGGQTLDDLPVKGA